MPVMLHTVWHQVQCNITGTGKLASATSNSGIQPRSLSDVHLHHLFSTCRVYTYSARQAGFGQTTSANKELIMQAQELKAFLPQVCDEASWFESNFVP